jgi:S-adenosylmethionine decarboxylase
MIKNNETHNPLGRHLLVEFWGAKTIEDLNQWENILWNAAKAAKSNPLKKGVHKFEPQGVTGFVILEESHISFHTWPEKEYIAIDIYTCGQHTDPLAGMESLAKELSPKRIVSQLIMRGEEKK